MGKFTLPFANVVGLMECLIFVCEVNYLSRYGYWGDSDESINDLCQNLLSRSRTFHLYKRYAGISASSPFILGLTFISLFESY